MNRYRQQLPSTVSPLHQPPEHSQSVDRLLLTAREAAKALAISERTLFSLTKSGDVSCVRIGRSVRYDRRDLEALIEASKSAEVD